MLLIEKYFILVCALHLFRTHSIISDDHHYWFRGFTVCFSHAFSFVSHEHDFCANTNKRIKAGVSCGLYKYLAEVTNYLRTHKFQEQEYDILRALHIWTIDFIAIFLFECFGATCYTDLFVSFYFSVIVSITLYCNRLIYSEYYWPTFFFLTELSNLLFTICPEPKDVHMPFEDDSISLHRIWIALKICTFNL